MLQLVHTCTCTYNVHVHVHVGVSSLICYVCTYFYQPCFYAVTVATQDHSFECLMCLSYKQLDDVQHNNVPIHIGQASVWSVVAVIPFHHL